MHSSAVFNHIDGHCIGTGQPNDTLQNDTLPTEEIGSFEKLEYDINNTDTPLEITKGYRNDNYTDGITIERDNLVINGNNHTIDGNGKNIFCIKESNITINGKTTTAKTNSKGIAQKTLKKMSSKSSKKLKPTPLK